MQALILFALLLIGTLSSNAQVAYSKPDFSVQYVSYFGIGSESVQKPSVLGNNATNYARMQKAFPELTGQGIGVPVHFYQATLKACGADVLIQDFIKNYVNLKEKEIEAGLKAIRSKILAATIPKSLVNQLNNAIDEFYKQKKIKLSASPNYQPFSYDKYHGVKPTTVIVTEQKDLAKSIAKLYASFWEKDSFYDRLTKPASNLSELVLGFLVTEAVEYGYAIGRTYTGYSDFTNNKTKDIFIQIMSKKVASTEWIGFSNKDSKWYQTETKAAKGEEVFVGNAPLTPIARQLQAIAPKLDPILRALKPSKEWKFYEEATYKAVVTFIIIKKGTTFSLRLQQPELQMTWSK